ncbi:MAG: glycogen-binding domain-containing protein [Gemmatimonadaceae bacterium]
MADNRGDPQEAEDAAFLERVARPLRSAESLDDTFEQRLMEKVRREASALYPERARTQASWWRRERIVRLSPLSGLAAAAGLAGIIALASLGGSNRSRSDSVLAFEERSAAQTAIRSDTVHLVQFVFVDSGASSVEIVGDFNAWTKGVNRLERSGAPGVWTISIDLGPGLHEYAFIIDGSHWIADPLAAKSSDDFGTESAVINVRATGQSAT